MTIFLDGWLAQSMVGWFSKIWKTLYKPWLDAQMFYYIFFQWLDHFPCLKWLFSKGRRISDFSRIPDYRIVKYFRSRISDTGYQIPDQDIRCFHAHQADSGMYISINKKKNKLSEVCICSCIQKCLKKKKRQNFKKVNNLYGDKKA